MSNMPRVDTRGPSGLALVKLGKTGSGKSAVMVGFLDEDGSVGDKYTIIKSGDNVPEYVQPGKFFVSLSSDRKKITGMKPISGSFSGHIKNFIAKEGEKPTPKTRAGQYGPYEVFASIIEILKPEKYAGMNVYLELPYKFVPTMKKFGNEMKEIAGIPISKSASVGMLEDYILATKAADVGPIPYSDNVLPTLQKRILRQDAEFEFVMKNGWVSAINPPDVNEGQTEDENEDWGDTTKKEPAKVEEPTKKPPKKPVVEDGVTDWGDPDEVDAKETDEDDDKEEDVPWDDVTEE